MTDEKPSTPKLVRACLYWGLLVIGVYVGAYWFFVQPGLAIRMGKTRAVPRYTESRAVHKYLEYVFWPVYQVDYYLRPSLWQIEFSDDPLMMKSDSIR